MPYNSFVGEIFPSPRRRGPAISPLSSQTQYLTTLPTQCYGAILALLWNLLRIRAFISLLYQHYQGHYHPVKCKWWHRLRIIWINLESNWFLSSCNGSLSKNAEEFLNNTLQISQWWNMVLSNLRVYNFSSDFSIESYKMFAVKSIYHLPNIFLICMNITYYL